nr:hypothetical protein [Acidiferrobacterales bacterium]
NESGFASSTYKAVFSVTISIHKSGYYSSRYEFKPDGDVRISSKDFVLRKVGKKVPLFAKRYLGEIPDKNTVLYFDFEVGDWVVPYGNGAEKHIAFTFQGSGESVFVFSGSLEISFANDGDGLVQQNGFVDKYSDFKMEKLAPRAGYHSNLVISKTSTGTDSKVEISSSSGNQGKYGTFIRTNTKLNEKDDVISANYAKIYGEVDFSPHYGELAFTYFYNPVVNSRNLELDFENNKAIYNSSRERVLLP